MSNLSSFSVRNARLLPPAPSPSSFSDNAALLRPWCCGDGEEYERVCGGCRKRVEEEQTAAEEVEKSVEARRERGERIRARIHRRVAGKLRG